MSDVDKTVKGIRTILQKELQDLFDSLTDDREALDTARRNIELYDERINKAHEAIEKLEGKIDDAEADIRQWVEDGATGTPSKSKRQVRDLKAKIVDEKDLIDTLVDARKEQVESIRSGNLGTGLEYDLSAAFHINLKGIKNHLENKMNEYIQLVNDLQILWSREIMAFTQANGLSVIHPDYSTADREEQTLLVPRKPQGEMMGQWVQALLNAIDDTGLTIEQLRAESAKEVEKDAEAAEKLTVKPYEESEVIDE